MYLHTYFFFYALTPSPSALGHYTAAGFVLGRLEVMPLVEDYFLVIRCVEKYRSSHFRKVSGTLFGAW